MTLEGPSELIDRAYDTLSTVFVERLRSMADAGDELLPTGAPVPAATVREEISEHVARVKEQGFTVIKHVIPTDRVAQIREDVVKAAELIKDDEYEKFWQADLPEPEIGMRRNAKYLMKLLTEI